MRLLHKALKIVVDALQKCEMRKFILKARKLVKWRYIPIVISYCSDVPEEKDMSAL